MALNIKLPNLKLPSLKFPFPSVLAVLRFVFMKALGLVLAVFFLFLALVFLGYSTAALVTTFKGREAKVVSISNAVGTHRTACRVGGLFMVGTEAGKGKEKAKDKNIYTLYPAWPDQLQPALNDTIQVWPSKKPLVGAPLTDSWGWFIVGTLLILGLIMLEFAFLSLTFR